MTRYAALVGLGFGDCGKGLFTDALCRRWQAHTVVRYNGGAQAGHNVVLPDGRHHTFSQFGAGSFVPSVATVLASPVVVHPTALLVEHNYLQKVGVSDALTRLLIDARCRITTPFHQAAGRLRELERGVQAHGTCGVGVGETVRQSLKYPEEVLQYADLLSPTIALEKLEHARCALLAEFAHLNGAQYAAELGLLADASVAARWLQQAATLARQVLGASPERFHKQLTQPGTVLFEGAQGMLLDEWRGFHPHTSWSSMAPSAASAVLQELGITSPLEAYGVLRSYLTRHGAGPLPTYDAALDCLAEPHNHASGWQGGFRRGHLDGVLLRYSCAIAGSLEGLLVSHLDVFERLKATKQKLQMYSAYSTQAGIVCELSVSSRLDLAHQTALTQLLMAARPQYDSAPITNAADCIERLATVAGCPVVFGGFGPTHATVQELL